MLSDINFSNVSFMTFIWVYVAGLATSFTPCVYPIIPIVVGYLGNQTGNKKQRFLIAVSYVLGISFTYACLGLVAAISGLMFGELTSTMPVYLIFGGFILFLSGTMMDWYQMPLPRFLQSQATHPSQKFSLGKSFLIGTSSGIVASPCTAPVLGSLLAYIATQKNYISGASLMFSFSLGMNTLLLVLGYSAGTLQHLPRSGKWMKIIKKGMALCLLIGGLYFIFRAGQIS